jgi:hypothetical protein
VTVKLIVIIKVSMLRKNFNIKVMEMLVQDHKLCLNKTRETLKKQKGGKMDESR